MALAPGPIFQILGREAIAPPEGEVTAKQSAGMRDGKATVKLKQRLG